MYNAIDVIVHTRCYYYYYYYYRYYCVTTAVLYSCTVPIDLQSTVLPWYYPAALLGLVICKGQSIGQIDALIRASDMNAQYSVGIVDRFKSWLMDN